MSTNMERLLRKLDTAKQDPAASRLRTERQQARPASARSITARLRLPCTGASRSSPSAATTSTCCGSAPFRSIRMSPASSPVHDFVFVVEQNRDAQMRSLLVNECGIDPVRLVPDLHYDRDADYRARIHRPRNRRSP